MHLHFLLILAIVVVANASFTSDPVQQSNDCVCAADTETCECTNTNTRCYECNHQHRPQYICNYEGHCKLYCKHREGWFVDGTVECIYRAPRPGPDVGGCKICGTPRPMD
ncbi:hypothetical protein P9112_001097 [Eukaryota sp. TZLM1-RC]